MHTSAGYFARSRPVYALFNSSSRGYAEAPVQIICRRTVHGSAALARTRPDTRIWKHRHHRSRRSFASLPKPPEAGDTRSVAYTQQDLSAPLSSATASSSTTDGTQAHEEKTRTGEKKYYGSYRRRASRAMPETRVAIPEWFLTRNVQLHDEATVDEPRLEIVANPLQHIASEASSRTIFSQSTESSAAAKASTAGEQKSRSEALYQIDKVIFDEISYMMLGGLRASSTSSTEDALNSRPHLLLQSPLAGAETFLNTVVAHAAKTQQLDLLTIDPQDIAEVAAEVPDAFPERSLAALRRLGFDTYIFEDEQFLEGSEESSHDQDSADDVHDMHAEDASKSNSVHVPMLGAGSIKPLQQMIQVWFTNKGSKGQSPLRRASDNAIPNFFTTSGKPVEVYNATDHDAASIIREYLEAPQLKRERSKTSPLEMKAANATRTAHGLIIESDEAAKNRHGLIVHIKDYLELSATSIGGTVLDRIHAVVDAKRREGRQVLIVGTSSSADLVPSLSESGFSAMQAGSDSDKFRTIVTTCKTPGVESAFVEDAKTRTAQINCRNILATLRELYPDPSALHSSLSEPNFGLTSEQMFQYDLAEEIWPLERVQRMASLASGMLKPGEPISGHVLSLGLGIMEVSDKAKFEWVSSELKRLEPPPSQQNNVHQQEEKRKGLLKSCNRYEKKLMGGVVDGSRIKTTFADVHVPPPTVEALKTLTTLSLVRPEAFTYGVLATDKIPGLLLYGPPGTGKTMLAKAVAKESGATVLEVAGSDIYDMYVGEGEKNIRAIFTLARKLSPCVVFIDEADAIFGSRNGSHNRKSHRELINQFLREWDGMNDLSAFIMVATNRPFDLDDAVLRRLPRRLLVDLPTEKDREAILAIHLKGENLAKTVSLTELAAKTPFYSGSDLKNLSVAAALACVREENDEAAKHTGNEAYVYPEKRTLQPEHFDKAVSEISASISEDMSSLSAIRKFDERYGDRKGRRKRSSGLGFGLATPKEQQREQLEDGRVRKADVA